MSRPGTTWLSVEESRVYLPDWHLCMFVDRTRPYRSRLIFESLENPFG